MFLKYQENIVIVRNIRRDFVYATEDDVLFISFVEIRTRIVAVEMTTSVLNKTSIQFYQFYGSVEITAAMLYENWLVSLRQRQTT